MERINVTKTFLPPIEEYETYLRKIWASGQLTNQGPLLQEFESQVSQRLGVNSLQLIANGTWALQVALRALDITEGEIITTPFTYVATTSSIMWERCDPVFVDIDPETFCIDADKIEAVITKNTRAIMAVHVFGSPCEIEKIEEIAKRHNLKVIYDGAHAFGVTYRGKSLLNYGDIATCSFHATKLFHTIEGGCVITKDKAVSDRVNLMKRFGHEGDNHYRLGTNVKATEFQAAMGLCNLKYIDENIRVRKKIHELYNNNLDDTVRKPIISTQVQHNYSYYPVLFKTESALLEAVQTLNSQNIFPRRYFYPSLNTLPYIEDQQSCPISEDIAKRVLCLPLYAGLEEDVVTKICKVINE